MLQHFWKKENLILISDERKGKSDEGAIDISLIIPSPFSEQHDEYIKKCHEAGKYSIVDNQQLVLYFTNKNNNIFEARLLVKVVPNGELPPYFSAIIKPTAPKYEIILINDEMIITGFTLKCSEYFDIGSSKNSELKVASIVNGFDEKKEQMQGIDGFEYSCDHDKYAYKLRFKLSQLKIGEHTCFILKIEEIEKKDKNETRDFVKLEDGIKPISSILPVETDVSEKIKVSNGEHPKKKKNSVSDSDRKKKKKDNSEGNTESKGSDDSEESESEESEESEEASEGSKEASEEESEESEESEDESDENASLSDKAKLDSTRVMDKAILSGENIKQSKEKNSSSTASVEEQKKDKEEPKKVHIDDFEAIEGSENSSSHSSNSESKSNSDDDFSEKSSEESHKISEGKEEHAGEGGDAQSASSKSMNSSIASLAQFNKSIKGLVAYEFSSTKKYVLRFKLTLIITIIVLIFTSILTYEVIDTSITSNETLSHYVNLVGNCRHYSRSLSYYSRMISLNDNITSFSNATYRSLYFG